MEDTNLTGYCSIAFIHDYSMILAKGTPANPEGPNRRFRLRFKASPAPRVLFGGLNDLK